MEDQISQTANGKASENEKVKKSGKWSDHEEPEKHIPKGMECDVKNLYRATDKYGLTMWSEKYPEDIDPPVENEASMHFHYSVLAAKMPLT